MSNQYELTPEELCSMLIMESYCAQREYGMTAEVASNLFGIDMDSAERYYNGVNRETVPKQ